MSVTTSAPFTPEYLKLWSHPSNYLGATWEGWYCFLAKGRDSDCLERSNFRVGYDAIKDLAVDVVDGEDELSGVTINRERHWACGWIEWIAIHYSNTEALEAADDMARRLEQYPILDEEDWSNLEWDEAASYWEGCSISERVEWCQRYRVSVFAARRDELPEDPTGELVSALAA